jgi:hypothetical protein
MSVASFVPSLIGTMTVCTDTAANVVDVMRTTARTIDIRVSSFDISDSCQFRDQ